MAQTVPPPSNTPRPLPRFERGRAAGNPKSPKPRFHIIDAVWVAVILTAYGITAFAGHTGRVWLTGAAFCNMGTLLATYLLGWRIAGRSAGVVAGLLAATSFQFAMSHATWESGAFTLTTVAALFACAADLPLIACALAGLAFALRPDGILLALLLLAVFSIRLPKQALRGAAAVFVTGAVGLGVRLATHQPMPAPVFHAETWPWGWAVRHASLFLLWFLVPFCADLTDPLRGPRWTPVALWGVAYALVAAFVHFAPAPDTAQAMMPIVFVAIGGGLARLLPATAGERPELRYLFAILAVLTLIGIRGAQEWPQQSPVPAAISVPAAIPVPVAVTPSVLEAAPPMPAVRPKVVPLYALHNGKLVKRSKWAIHWDKTHPVPHAATPTLPPAIP